MVIASALMAYRWNGKSNMLFSKYANKSPMPAVPADVMPHSHRARNQVTAIATQWITFSFSLILPIFVFLWKPVLVAFAQSISKRIAHFCLSVKQDTSARMTEPPTDGEWQSNEPRWKFKSTCSPWM